MNIPVYNKHVGPHYCPAEMYAGLVACSPWDSQTDGQTPERYITIFATSVMIEHIKYTDAIAELDGPLYSCLLYTSPSPRDRTRSRMPSSA